jgi:hypothetical protein
MNPESGFVAEWIIVRAFDICPVAINVPPNAVVLMKSLRVTMILG